MISALCRICDKPIVGTLVAKEMMFGLDATFTYEQCGSCGTLHLQDPPGDWGPYYPSSYYSFVPHLDVSPPIGLQGTVKKWALGALLAIPLPAGVYRMAQGLDFTRWFRGLDIHRDSRILDVGCGSGELLVKMANSGFTDLTGLDRFLPDASAAPTGIRLVKGELAELAGEKFDLIMFHHTLEHVDNPLATMREVRGLLSPHGACLIRVPVADSWLFEHYGADWVQLDAPRHQWLLTKEAVRVLSKKTGFGIKEVIHDSEGVRLWQSELYRKGMPLVPTEAGVTSRPRFPDKGSLRELDKRARKLNRAGLGDQACFLLRVSN